MADYFGSLNRLLNSFKEKVGLQNLIPGTKGYQIAESIAYEQTMVENAITEYSTKNSIFTATNSDLDKIGNDIFGIPRLQEEQADITKSMKILKFYVEIGVFGDINRGENGLPQDIILPKGVSITGNINGIYYSFTTDSEYILGQNESEKYISAKMVQGDITMIPTNTLINHSFLNYSTAITKLLKVTNPSPISTGRAKETDDNYRYRISNSLRSHLTTTYYGIENALLTVPGVSSVTILNATSGGGTFTVFVQGITPVTSDDVISRCKDTLKTIIPPWVAYNVLKPYYIGIECILNVIVAQKNDTITTNVIAAVSDTINNFGGNEFYINTILQQAQLSDSNILDVSFEMCRKHSGAETYRVYEDIFTSSNPYISLYQLEKLIVEPISSAIVVNQIV